MHYFASKGPSSQGYGFSSGHVWMWELEYKESWAPKNWCFWTVVLEKTLESPLDGKGIQPVHPEDQSWVFIWRTDAEAETPILWPPDAKSWLIWKDPDAGKDWGQEEQGTAEHEMPGWHHQFNGYEFGWAPAVCVGQGGLAYWSSWGRKESDTTERLNWTELNLLLMLKTLKAGREGDDRGWDGWIASPAQWTWVWASSGSWWWTGKPGALQSMGSQRGRHGWATPLNSGPPGIPWWYSGEESICQSWRHKRRGCDPWPGRSPRVGNSNPLQCSCLGNPMDRGVWGPQPTGSQRVGHNWTTEPTCMQSLSEDLQMTSTKRENTYT